MLLAVLATGMATAAAAQGGGNYGRAIDTPENRADAALRRSAACAVGANPASARRVLDTNVGSEEEAKRVRTAIGLSRACFGANWAMPPTLFRNALAEVAYRAAFMKADPVPAGGVAPASFAVAGADAPATPDQTAARQLGALGNCVVFAAPAETRLWVLGPRNVAEEERRFAAVRPAIERCSGPEAAKVLTTRNFRGPVANALLERAARVDRTE